MQFPDGCRPTGPDDWRPLWRPASLGALRGLRLDYAKIYGAFVHGLHEDRDRQTLVRSLVSIAHGMGLKMVAEFVENEAELEVVTEIGFDAVQGYHVGRPAALQGTSE